MKIEELKTNNEEFIFDLESNFNEERVIMTIKDFKKCITQNIFNDYDGYFKLIENNSYIEDKIFYPSELEFVLLNYPNLKEIEWFNK